MSKSTQRSPGTGIGATTLLSGQTLNSRVTFSAGYEQRLVIKDFQNNKTLFEKTGTNGDWPFNLPAESAHRVLTAEGFHKEDGVWIPNSLRDQSGPGLVNMRWEDGGGGLDDDIQWIGVKL